MEGGGDNVMSDVKRKRWRESKKKFRAFRDGAVSQLALRVWVNPRVMPVELRGNEPHSVQQHLSATLYPCPSLRS
ncbi:unnamed protein product [Pleuronectes platessa]|uniref:Uncharacterized protein n=1 Tax=Pleuronectes platessa TaxID=8262 RepID=A0A9N7TNZ1_PLEPL|nr:unnamed protein product [Pleuronectes platessa]